MRLPAGWEGRIFCHPGGDPTLHAGNFALPVRDGEFGTRALLRMAPGSVFVAVTEYRPGRGLIAGRGLFAHRVIPHPLQHAHFSPGALHVARAGLLGFQHFFSAGPRPFCLYAVLHPHRGRVHAAAHHVDAINAVVGSLAIETHPPAARGT